MNNTFRKEERLCNQVLIDKLFRSGRSFTIFPLKVHYLWIDHYEEAPSRVVVSVSKKLHKNATTRNKIKRRIKEAYRLNKNDIIENLQKNNASLLLAFIYTSKLLIPYKKLETIIIIILHRLILEHEKHTG